MDQEYRLSEISLYYKEQLRNDVIRAFGHFKGIPVRCLEIGIFEGGSATLLLDSILTHDESYYLGIDDNLREVALFNLAKHPRRKWDVVAGDSNRMLPKIIGKKTFDMIYIDGCHHVEYALKDLYYAFKLLNSGGVILVDDYAHEEYKLKEEIDRFIEPYLVDHEILFRDYRIAIQKEPSDESIVMHRDLVLTPEFWRKRLLTAHATGRGLFSAIYDTDPETWNGIQNKTAGLLQRYVEPGSSVIDIGCGYGAIFELIPPNVSYVGIDVSPDLVEIAQLRYPDGRFLVADVTSKTQFTSSQFDYAICRSIKSMILLYVGQYVWKLMLTEIMRIAKKVLIIDYDTDDCEVITSPVV